MNNKPLDKSTHEDVRKVDAALQRAAKKARELARQTQTQLVIMRNGKLYSEVPAAENNQHE